MLLKDYIPNIKKRYSNFFFSGISFDSSKIKRNEIFFAIKGNYIDGNDFISVAVKKGAKIIVSEKKFKEFQNGVLFIQTQNIRRFLAEISFKIFNKRPKNLIAVTGTNGKSSIADFYFQILNLNKKKVASVGTLGVKSKNYNLKLQNTTIDPMQLGQILKKLKKKKIENVIIEASSHGLKQNRLDGLKFKSGIFTNLSHDHLDYHKNFKAYLKAKLYLFENLIDKKGNVITDKSIPEFKKIKKIAKDKNLKLNAINTNNDNLKILSHTFMGETQIIKLKYNNLIKTINLNLIGKIQIKNILMAVIAANKSNIEFKNILNVISKIKPVDGRFEKIGTIKNQSKVILDYAHTPEALKTCLLNLKEQFPHQKISLVFGCGGDRDKDKRATMGKIANYYSDKIYLTDDNPRFEKPESIRKEIKRGITRKKFNEIPNRAKAIFDAIKNLNTGEILLVAGKGHEKTQIVGNNKIFFSDKKIILNAIKIKNSYLSNDLKLNILNEVSKNKKLSLIRTFYKARIDSREVRANDIFFAIKGKKDNGNKYVSEAFRKKASIAIVNKIQKKFSDQNQILVKDTLGFLTEVSKVFRKNINTNIIAVTGSCGKTTLKELLGNTLKQISKVSISPKSFNNKYGVPLSLLNLSQNDNFGILEVGMDKKGEIDYLTKIIQPDVSVITNINYAHIKNFKSIRDIALAKSEIIENTKPKGFIVLNADDNFFKLHKKKALNRKLNIISFGIKNKKSNIKFVKINKKGKYYEIVIKKDNIKKIFSISNEFQNYIYNILSALSVISIYYDISNLNKNIFLNFKIPDGRGDLSTIKIKNKKINLIDESYNSNPLSLESALINYDKIDSKKKKKYLLLGDMLELGKYSKKLHKSIVPVINKTKIDKVYVKGKKISNIFNKILKSKKGKILNNRSQIVELIKNDLNNNDYLMIKASNATGLNRIIKEIKGSD
tara:strand:- start:1012 stop:3855 length:2844 start_codon:yes stop_codon:yes gene_type:complete